MAGCDGVLHQVVTAKDISSDSSSDKPLEKKCREICLQIMIDQR